MLLNVSKQTSAEERSNEKFPFLSFRFVQNWIILYIFEAEGGGPLIHCLEISDITHSKKKYLMLLVTWKLSLWRSRGHYNSIPPFLIASNCLFLKFLSRRVCPPRLPSKLGRRFINPSEFYRKSTGLSVDFHRMDLWFSGPEKNLILYHHPPNR